MDQVSFTGFLTSGGVQIGGDTTGWVLQTRNSGDIEVDMSGIRKPERFSDRDVTITGAFRTESYITRGPTEILVAKKIKATDA